MKIGIFVGGCIAGIGMLALTGCSTMVVGDSVLKDNKPIEAPKPAPCNVNQKPQVVIHYHVLVVAPQNKYATGFGPYNYWEILNYNHKKKQGEAGFIPGPGPRNADHRKQRGRTAPNRALKEEQCPMKDLNNTPPKHKDMNKKNPGMRPDPPEKMK